MSDYDVVVSAKVTSTVDQRSGDTQVTIIVPTKDLHNVLRTAASWSEQSWGNGSPALYVDLLERQDAVHGGDEA